MSNQENFGQNLGGEIGEDVGIDLMFLLKMLGVDFTDINQCTD